MSESVSKSLIENNVSSKNHLEPNQYVTFHYEDDAKINVLFVGIP